MWLPLALFLSVAPCPDVVAPVPGPVVERFAPVGDYGGHWGVDFAAEQGSEVVVVADGIVTFAGSVAGRRSVSVDHGRGLVTTLSYLDSSTVSRGERVERGETVGTSGLAHGRAAVHLGFRVDGRYRDPMLLFSCRTGDITEALRLVPVPG